MVKNKPKKTNKTNKPKKTNKTNKPTKTKTRKHRHFRRSNKMGGEAVAAGSYGCVFRPPIKCANNETVPLSHISKLMYNNESVVKEVEEMNKVKEIIKTIPNNEKYFLVMNTTVCSPDKLTDADLNLFDEKCDLFTDKNITSKNVNSNLNKLKLITMPDGGMEVDDYIQNLLFNPNQREKYSSFIKINSGLIDLLNNGIVPINKSGLNHMDIKGNNVLIDKLGRVRLIDWGLACKNDGLSVPIEVTNHTMHFNNPFSNLFYNNYLKQWLPNEYKKIKASPQFHNSKSGQAELLKIVAVNMVNNVLEYNKTSGHYKSIVSILHYLYKIYALDNGYNTIDYNVLIQSTIIEYIQSVLLGYVDDNGKFKDVEYFNDVFSKNVDIWGFLMSYLYIIEKGIVYDDNNTAKYMIDKEIINSISRILIKYCYSTEYAIKAINVSELSKELESLNVISGQIMKQQGKKNVYTKPIKNDEYVNEKGIFVQGISL